MKCECLIIDVIENESQLNTHLNLKICHFRLIQKICSHKNGSKVINNSIEKKKISFAKLQFIHAIIKEMKFS